jgi:DNA-binding transcriptional MerR regulator
MKYFSTLEVQEKTGVAYYRVVYAHKMGRLPEPKHFGFRRLYTQADIDRIKAYFSNPNLRKVAAI